MISMMMTGVFISWISMNDHEEHITVLFTRQMWEHDIRCAAATMLQRAWRVRSYKRLGEEHRNGARGFVTLLRLEDGHLHAQNALRRLRRKEPKSLDTRGTIDDIQHSLASVGRMVKLVVDNQVRASRSAARLSPSNERAGAASWHTDARRRSTGGEADFAVAAMAYLGSRG